jgi:hypothetical protein
VKILDSNWFRQSFSADLQHETDLGFQGALQTLAEFVEEVFAISVMSYLRPKNPPETSVILKSETFDAFMHEWSATYFEPHRWVRKYAAIVGATVREKLPEARIDLLIKNTLDHVPMTPFCMPLSLVEKLSRVGRIPLTLTLALSEGVNNAELEIGKKG